MLLNLRQRLHLSRRLLVGGVLMSVAIAPALVASAGAAQAIHHSSHVTLRAKATVNCGGETIVFSSDNDVTYGQIHATNVSCAVAKQVVRLGGRHDGTPPKGWTFASSKVVGSNCAFTWRNGKELVTGFTPDDAGC